MCREKTLTRMCARAGASWAQPVHFRRLALPDCSIITFPSASDQTLVNSWWSWSLHRASGEELFSLSALSSDGIDIGNSSQLLAPGAYQIRVRSTTTLPAHYSFRVLRARDAELFTPGTATGAASAGLASPVMSTVSSSAWAAAVRSSTIAIDLLNITVSPSENDRSAPPGGQVLENACPS